MFAGGAQSRGLRKPGGGHCYLRFFLFTPYGVNNVQLLRDSELIRLLETPRSLSEYILKMDM